MSVRKPESSLWHHAQALSIHGPTLVSPPKAAMSWLWRYCEKSYTQLQREGNKDFLKKAKTDS
jgi:hypothetical protein